MTPQCFEPSACQRSRGRPCARPVAPTMPGGRADVRRRMISGVGWTVVICFAGQGSTFLSSIVSARFLGYEDYGRLATIQSVAVALAGFAALGLAATSTKFVSELRSRAPERAGRVLGLCAVTTLVTGATYAIGLAALSPWIARHLLHAEALCGHLRLGALYVCLFALNSYQIGSLVGFEAFSRLARVNGILGPLSLLLIAGLTWSLGLRGAVLAMPAAMLCSWGLHQRALRAECRRQGIRIRYDHLRRELGVLLQCALPAASSGCLGGLAVIGASAMLVRQPRGFEEMALFSAANTVRLVLVLVPGMVVRVSAPMLCNLRAHGDGDRYRRTFWTCLAFSGGLTALMAALLFPAAPLVLSLFGKQYAQGGNVLGLLMAVAVTEAIAVVLFQTLYSHGILWTHFAIQVVWATLLLGCTWCLVSRGGATALAASYGIAWTASLILYGVVAKTLLRRAPADHCLHTLATAEAV